MEQFSNLDSRQVERASVKIAQDAFGHLRDRKFAAFQCSTTLCGVQMWVEAFFGITHVRVSLSFDLANELAWAEADVNEESCEENASAVGRSFRDCAHQLMNNLEFIAAREAVALAASLPVARSGEGPRRI